MTAAGNDRTDPLADDPNAPPPCDEDALLDALHDAGVAYALHRHPAVFTVDEAQAHCAHLPGAHVKNMALKDKKGALWLVTCRDDRKIRLRDLEKVVGAAKFSFLKPEALWSALGVRPGAVTPFALINDREQRRVTPILDRQLLDAALVNVHPLHNEATLAVAPADLMAVLARWDRTPLLVDFDALEAAARDAP